MMQRDAGGSARPADDDYITIDYRIFWQNGKIVLVVKPDRQWSYAVLCHMEEKAKTPYPNVWLLKGNKVELIDMFDELAAADAETGINQ